jgi:hypothetical protein
VDGVLRCCTVAPCEDKDATQTQQQTVPALLDIAPTGGQIAQPIPWVESVGCRQWIGLHLGFAVEEVQMELWRRSMEHAGKVGM